MYKILHNYLQNADYTLEDAQGRIDYHVARGNITPEQAAELTKVAEARALDPVPDLEDRVENLETAMDNLVQTKVEPSDKLGYNFKNTYIAGVLVQQEYVELPSPDGTAGNPIPWTPETILEPNAYYTCEGVRKVWTGESGVTADWYSDGWEVF